MLLVAGERHRVRRAGEEGVGDELGGDLDRGVGEVHQDHAAIDGPLLLHTAHEGLARSPDRAPAVLHVLAPGDGGDRLLVEPRHDLLEEVAVAVVLDHGGQLEHGIVLVGRRLGRGEARGVDQVGPGDQVRLRAHVDPQVPRHLGDQLGTGAARGVVVDLRPGFGVRVAHRARQRQASRLGVRREPRDVVVEVPGEPRARRVAEVEDGVLVPVEPLLGDGLHPGAVAAGSVPEVQVLPRGEGAEQPREQRRAREPVEAVSVGRDEDVPGLHPGEG